MGWDLADAARPAFLSVAPSNLKGSHLGVASPESSGGMAWERVIHQVFEQLVKGTNELNAVILAILSENNRPAEKLDEVRKVVEEFKLSELWQRLSRSELKLSEVSFAIKLEKGDLLIR